MNKKFNVNIINKNSSTKVISRGKTKKNIKMPNELNKGEIIITKGTKGWLEHCNFGYYFELDTPFKYPNWHGSLYRLDYISKDNLINEQIECYEASNDERIEYLIKNINVERKVRGLKVINPNNIRFCLNMDLTNNLDLDVAVQTYLDDIKNQTQVYYI